MSSFKASFIWEISKTLVTFLTAGPDADDRVKRDVRMLHYFPVYPASRVRRRLLSTECLLCLLANGATFTTLAQLCCLRQSPPPKYQGCCTYPAQKGKYGLKVYTVEFAQKIRPWWEVNIVTCWYRYFFLLILKWSRGFITAFLYYSGLLKTKLPSFPLKTDCHRSHIN